MILLRSQHALGNDVVSKPSTLPGRCRTLFMASCLLFVSLACAFLPSHAVASPSAPSHQRLGNASCWQSVQLPLLPVKIRGFPVLRRQPWNPCDRTKAFDGKTSAPDEVLGLHCNRNDFDDPSRGNKETEKHQKHWKSNFNFMQHFRIGVWKNSANPCQYFRFGASVKWMPEASRPQQTALNKVPCSMIYHDVSWCIKISYQRMKKNLPSRFKQMSTEPAETLPVFPC